MAAPATTVLDPRFFLGIDSNANTADIVNCEALNNDEAIDDILRGAGWDGASPVASVMLHLSPDNKRVTASRLITRGGWEGDIERPAHKVWEEADMSILLTIRPPHLSNFHFSGGGLASDYLPDEEVVQFYHHLREGAAPAPMLSPNLERWNLGRFCVRLVCHPDRNSTAETGLRLKFFLMLYPPSKRAILSMGGQTREGSWSRYKLVEGEMIVLPTPTTPWGCPIVPLLRPAVPFGDMPTAPSSDTLRQGVAAVMSGGGSPRRDPEPRQA